MSAKKLLFTVGAVLFTAVALAQSYSIDRFTIAAGGGLSGSGEFSVNGTIGQPDATASIPAGPFSLAGGFWSVLSEIQVPDGAIIYCRVKATDSSSTIWIAKLDGSGDVLLTSGYRAHLSIDRRHLVFVRDDVNGAAYNGRGFVWVRDLVNNSETRVFAHSDYVIGADLTRDTSQVIFDYSCAIWRIKSDGTDNNNAGVLLSGDCYNDAPVVNPVDGRVAFHNTFRGILVGDTNAQNQSLVANSTLGVYPHWSSDGQWLSFVNQTNSQEYAGHNLYKIRPDGSNLTQLTFFGTNAPDRFPEGSAWTTDGTALIGAGTINGTNGLYRIAADGSGNITILSITQPGDPIRYVGAVLGQPEAPFELRVTGVEPVGPDLRLSMFSRMDKSYEVQSRPSLSSGDWTTILGSAQSGTGGILHFTLSNALSQTQQFYRVRQLP